MRISESDDEVRQNIPEHLIPLFERVRPGIKKCAGKSRTEVFLEYVEEHPGEEIEAVDRTAEWRLKQELRPMLDFYETPAWAIRAIVPALRVKEGTRILDPGCGTGAILRCIGAAFPDEFPCDVFVLSRRPSFLGNGMTDSSAYAWFVWGPGRGGRWSLLKTPETTKGNP